MSHPALLCHLQELACATTLIEIVIAWGVTPSLSPGMGVPLDLRLKNTSLRPFFLCTSSSCLSHSHTHLGQSLT